MIHVHVKRSHIILHSTIDHMVTHSSTYYSAMTMDRHIEVFRILNPLFLVLHLVISLLIVCGNGLTIYVIIRKPRLRSLTNSLVISLSTSDMLLGLLVPICATMEHSQLLGVTFKDRDACVLCKSFYAGTMFSSIFSLFAIAVDRSVAVNYPLRYLTIRSGKKMYIFKAILWCWALLTALFMILTSTWKPGVLCLINYIIPKWIYYSYGIGVLLTVNITTSVLYLQIFWIARKQRQKIGPYNSVAAKNLVDSKQNHKSTKMMALILGLFLLSWIPYLITGTIHSAMRNTPHHIYVEVFFRFLSLILFSNSFVNPIIYGWKNKQFRKAYKEVLSLSGKANVSNMSEISRPRSKITTVT